MLRLIANLLWFILGGALMGIAWWLFGLLAMLSIVGIPWARASFVIGNFTFFPFGKEAVNREIVNQQSDIGTGVFGSLGNIIWFIFAGLWLCIAHLIAAFGSFISIIGIPFGIQHVKLAMISLAPIGKAVVET